MRERERRQMQEFGRVRQNGRSYKRLFTDEEFDLYVWYTSKGGAVTGFQLVYDKHSEPRAFTWTSDEGCRHDRVDAGDSERWNLTPVLVADGPLDQSAVARKFLEHSGQMDPGIVDLVLRALARCESTGARRAAGGEGATRTGGPDSQAAPGAAPPAAPSPDEAGRNSGVGRTRRCVARRSRRSRYTERIALDRGQVVTVGEEYRGEEPWPGWVWCEAGSTRCWVPVQIVQSTGPGRGVVTEEYVATELDVDEGDVLEAQRELNGWVWARKTGSGDLGWVPAELLEELDGPRGGEP